MGTSFENGISVSFWAFLEHNANIFYLKTGLCFFGLVISFISNGISVFFSGLVMGTSFENGIMPISSV